MKWSHPKPYDTRIRSAFLWFPKRIMTETRWLEKARWVEKYRYSTRRWERQKWSDPIPGGRTAR